MIPGDLGLGGQAQKAVVEVVKEVIVHGVGHAWQGGLELERLSGLAVWGHGECQEGREVSRTGRHTST